MSNNTYDLLAAAVVRRMLEILKHPRNWIKGSAFGQHVPQHLLRACDTKYDGENTPIRTANPEEADCYCVLGALNAALGEAHHPATYVRERVGERIQGTFYTLLRSGECHSKRLAFRAVNAFNDHNTTTHADVLRLLRGAEQRLGGSDG